MNIRNSIMKAWSWRVASVYEVIELNRFGNVIFTDHDGAYWRLIPEELNCEIIAPDKVCFDQLKRDDVFVSDRKMEAICAIAQNALGELPEGSSYCLKLPAVLGHSYTAENMGIIRTEALISFSGDLAERIKDLPDGTEVKLSVE